MFNWIVVLACLVCLVSSVSVPYKDIDAIKLILEQYDRSFAAHTLAQQHRELLYQFYYTYYKESEHNRDNKLFNYAENLVLRKYYVDPRFCTMAKQFFEMQKNVTPSDQDWDSYFTSYSTCSDARFFLDKVYSPPSSLTNATYIKWNQQLPPLGSTVPGEEYKLSAEEEKRRRETDPFDNTKVEVVKSNSNIPQLQTKAELGEAPASSRRPPTKRSMWAAISFTILIIAVYSVLTTGILALIIKVCSKKTK